MNILRHLYLNSAAFSPDDPVAPEPVAADPPVAAVEPGAADPPAPEPAPEPELEPEPAPVASDPPAPEPKAPAPKPPAMVSLRVLQQRVGEETNKRQAIERRATEAEQRAAELQGIIDRMQTERVDPAAPLAARAPVVPIAPRTTAPPGDFDAAVKAETARQRYIEDTVDVLKAGNAHFADFSATRDILTAVGALNDEVIADLIAVDKDGAHEILDSLAKVPDRAAELAGMDSRRRIVELTRMSDQIKQAKAPAPAAEPKPTISRAPAPKPALAPQAPGAAVDPMTAEGDEKMSGEQWNEWYKNKYLKRA